ncbi:hypothetical protein Acsp04_49670 [Actinomadura sp. NBRC 104425]|uniref:hypothetical protein n=1 Tax=Actinomadura sp. NBRC 104425 TaxID=3032204 RepID=UPI00249FA5F3|nr:hypothetical protein [Actinomadura sp. NBRC 104425]GLZ14732.1 hypothetical protein Acsp04_49670 [Actinomadura sp. NBRC 104425]
MKRRVALGLGVAAAVAPKVLPRVLGDTAAEAMEFTQRANATALGRDTFAHLESALATLDRRQNFDPPADVFNSARAYRVRVAELIDGPRTPEESRELFVCAAWLSEILAWMAQYLGDPLAAEAWATDAYHHAEQAGHDVLCAFASDALASIAIYSNQPARALAAAQRGIAKAPARHPLSVRLRTQAARSHARLGDRDGFQEMFRQASDLHERLPARPPLRIVMETGSLAAFGMTGHTAEAYIWLGDTEWGDFARARHHAQNALDIELAWPDQSKSPSRTAMARLDLALALAGLAEPEEAAELGRQALNTSRLLAAVRRRAGELDRVLNERYRGLGAVQDFREAYRNSRTVR